MLEWATDYFGDRGVPEPRLSIEWLLAEVLDVKRLDLYLKFDRPLSSGELDELRPLVKRRAEHEPLQYILGFTEFLNARIQVTPDVLIPRIETEQLVEIILDRHTGEKELNVIDIGTGSGCIPVALKMERPGWKITGLDISGEALEVARENADLNEVNVRWLEGDIFDWKSLETGEEFDLVISNPPYVLPGEKDRLDLQVKKYEPSLALFCDNLVEMYGQIIQFAREHTTAAGTLYLEVHELHAGEINGLFDPDLWLSGINQDYSGKQRFIIAEKTSARP